MSCGYNASLKVVSRGILTPKFADEKIELSLTLISRRSLDVASSEIEFGDWKVNSITMNCYVNFFKIELLMPISFAPSSK